MTATREDLIELVKDGRRFRERRGWWERLWMGILVRLLIAPLDGWLFMLAVGFAHDMWVPALPTIGYWPATLLMLLFTAIVPRTGTGKAAS